MVVFHTKIKPIHLQAAVCFPFISHQSGQPSRAFCLEVLLCSRSLFLNAVVATQDNFLLFPSAQMPWLYGCKWLVSSNFPVKMFQNSEWQLCGQQCKALHNTFHNKSQKGPGHSAISMPDPLPISLTSHLTSPLLVPVSKLSQARIESRHSEICLNFNQQHRGGKNVQIKLLDYGN